MDHWPTRSKIPVWCRKGAKVQTPTPIQSNAGAHEQNADKMRGHKVSKDNPNMDRFDKNMGRAPSRWKLLDLGFRQCFFGLIVFRDLIGLNRGLL